MYQLSWMRHYGRSTFAYNLLLIVADIVQIVSYLMFCIGSAMSATRSYLSKHKYCVTHQEEQASIRSAILTIEP